jgi:hypothetical protein
VFNVITCFGSANAAAAAVGVSAASAADADAASAANAFSGNTPSGGINSKHVKRVSLANISGGAGSRARASFGSVDSNVTLIF